MEHTVAIKELEESQVTPSRIIETGMGFWASKTLLTAVNMGLFTLLSKGPIPVSKIRRKMGLHERGAYDFLDALVALGFLERKGIKENAFYSNSRDSDLYLDKKKRSYIGGMLEMCNNRLYPFWNNLEEGLKTGEPQNEVKNNGQPFFELLYSDEPRMREFISAMGGFQASNFIAFASKFDFSDYNTLCDIGGAGGFLSAQVAVQHPHMHCISFDLPKVSAIARENMERIDCTPRVTIQEGDFFEDPFPKADVITMGNILHDWGLEDKKMLIRKAYDALPPQGAFIAIENVIDDVRRKNATGLLMSLNMLIETEKGFDYTRADFDAWVKEAGFKSTKILELPGPASAIIAIK